jgi:hypothetical protein
MNAALQRQASVVPCLSCAGSAGRETAERTAYGIGPGWEPCSFCDRSGHGYATGREVLGELPDARAMASRLDAFVAGEMLCVASDVPAQAMDLLVLAAAVLRAAKGE